VLDYIIHLSAEIIPVFLLAIFFSSLIDHFLPDDYFKTALNFGNEFVQVVLFSILGSLVPICTCGMIPLAIKLNKKGLSWVMLVAFLTAGNANSIPAMLISTTLGTNFVLMRFVVSILFGLLTAYALKLVVRKNYELKLESGCCGHEHDKPSFMKKLWADIKEMSVSFLPWIALAIFLAALMHEYVGDGTCCCYKNWLVPFKESFFSPFIMSVVGFPFYFCAGADVPLAKEFMALGLPFGSILTFMLAAPGINLTSLLVYKKACGFKAAFVYLFMSILVISILGVLINLFQ
jgi:uncharacterized membrane protein YraQ (UPF0718 family)